MSLPNYFLFVSIFFYACNLKLAANDYPRRCEQSSGSISKTGIKNRAMQGHSFKSYTLSKPYDCHVKCFEERCKCQAYQMRQNRCELLDDDRISAPEDFLEEKKYTYYDMNREYVNHQTCAKKAEKQQPLINQCCNQNPCANGGTCTELFEDAKNKFNCTCAVKYYGRFCQKRRATSCKEQLKKNRGSRSRVYQLFDPSTISLYEVFCDAISEKGFVWTLIESFSRRNKNEFEDKPFYKGYPINQDAFTWSKFRLSLPRMIATANRSTHVRATCNFNTEELQYRDYFRAKLSDIDVMHLSFDGCKKYEFISIRGYNCTNCTAHFFQRDNYHAHTDSYWAPAVGCQFTSPSADAVKSPGGEDNFGCYITVNPVHRCVSNDDSTTQWWFGEHC